MADTRPIARITNGKPTNHQQSLIWRAMTHRSILHSTRKLIIKWFMSGYEITAGSNIEIALDTVHAIRPIW
jgi:hypothetical protein